MTTFTWPTAEEYDNALRQRATTCSDPEIQCGTLKTHKDDPDWPLRLNGGGSLSVLVYQVGNKVVRCFTSDASRGIMPPADIIQRYEGLMAYQRNARKGRQTLPFLTHHLWIKPGFRIQNTWYPFLKLGYISNTQRLGDFLSREHHHPPTLKRLAELWLAMIRQMEQRGIAHGDLDWSNVLVEEDTGTHDLRLHLIDFDGIYVPELAQAASLGMGLAEKGHLDFQYPPRDFGPIMDRFSALVIYISLCALAHKPVLWDRCHMSEVDPLLGAADFQRLSDSENYAILSDEKDNKQLQDCLQALRNAISDETMPASLDTILHITPDVHIPYVPIPLSPFYQGRRVPLPIEDALVEPTIVAPQPSLAASPFSIQPPPPTSPLSLPPIDVSPFSMQPPPPTSPLSPPPLAQNSQARANCGCTILFIVLFIALVVLLILWILSSHSQPGKAANILLIACLFQNKGEQFPGSTSKQKRERQGRKL